MKDFLDKFIIFIPQYIEDILGLIQSPKRFVIGRLSDDQVTLKDALIFLFISTSIIWLLEISFIQRDPLIELAEDIVFSFGCTLAFGAALCLAWRIVGGRADIKDFFFIHFYYAGVFRIMSGLGFMAIMGALRAGNSELYQFFLKAIRAGNASSSQVFECLTNYIESSPFFVFVFLL